MSIDVVIPIRDRELIRLISCISFLRKNTNVDRVIVVDYNSKDPIRLPKDLNAEIIRTSNSQWNKAHALNIGIKQSTSEYIMTMDCDMIMSKEIFQEINNNLDPKNIIINTNVRRIMPKDVSQDYSDMVPKSFPWFGREDRTQLFNQANGGFQVYSRDFYNKIGGINEGLGFYMGAMDNYIYYIGRLNDMNIVDVSYPLLHMEHDKRKEMNFDLTKEEQDIALGYRQFKALYLDKMIQSGILKNDSNIAEEDANRNMLDRFIKEYSNRNKTIDEAIKNKKETVEICGQTFKIEKQKPKILIVVINNYEMLPSYFVWDLFNLYNATKQIYPDVDIQQVNACEVSLMRNLAIKSALGDNKEKKAYNFVVQLDTDHRYPPSFLVRFIQKMEENDYDILTGLTDSKKETDGEHLTTQYYKIIKNINNKVNCVYSPEPKDEIIQIEASGPVGMVINTRVFKKLTLPYYAQEYQTNEKKNEVISTGSDIYFCKKLKEAKIPLHLDLMTSFPHEIRSFTNRGQIVQL